ncbi:Proteasome subunit alpha type-8 [Taenia crassiceps]|uniref:Proteasome subunit alpha type n=1 Tax=Taenia crassiceps TaxID=6207 RepID=A0ABR4QE23_9CEST
MTARYDRAITVFSPDGHLFQVEYAQEAVKKGSTAKATTKLQNDRTVHKISLLDEHIALAFAGLTADARILIDRMRIECKSYRLTVEDPVSVEYIARHMAQLKQKYTQSNGRRPFGVSTLLCGINQDGSTHLYQTDPSGTHFEWLAAREFLEKNYSEAAVTTQEDTIKLAVKALFEVVQTGAKHMELGVMKRRSDCKPGEPITEWKMLTSEEIEEYVKAIEREREEETEKKKQKKEASAAGSSF